MPVHQGAAKPLTTNGKIALIWPTGEGQGGATLPELYRYARGSTGSTKDARLSRSSDSSILSSGIFFLPSPSFECNLPHREPSANNWRLEKFLDKTPRPIPSWSSSTEVVKLVPL